jgi:hypothetical protein
LSGTAKTKSSDKSNSLNTGWDGLGPQQRFTKALLYHSANPAKADIGLSDSATAAKPETK